MPLTRILIRPLVFLTIFGVCIGCGEPEPRRPIEVKSGTFFKESVERSKRLLAAEEEQIKAIMASDTAHEYDYSTTGSWFYYDVKNDQTDYYPKPNDLVTLTYNIVTFNNDTLYSKEDIGTITYMVDKQELFPGLRNSIKLVREGETATFLFPSSLAYGYHGDNNKIGVNVPLKSTLTILNIEKQKDSLVN